MGRDDEAAIPQHRGRVADVEDLIQAVTDEQHGHVPVTRLPHDREQALDLVRGQGRRRLIQDEDACLYRERLGDLDELLVGHRQAANKCADIERHAQLIEQALRRLSHRPPLDRPETALGRVAHEHVLGH